MTTLTWYCFDTELTGPGYDRIRTMFIGDTQFEAWKDCSLCDTYVSVRLACVGILSQQKDLVGSRCLLLRIFGGPIVATCHWGDLNILSLMLLLDAMCAVEAG